MSLLQHASESNQPLSREAIRQQIRQRRQQIPVKNRAEAASDLATQVLNQQSILSRQHFALYLANDAELATMPLIQALWQAGKDVYLPVLHPFCPGYLLFLHYTPNTELQPNRFGIAEPRLNCQKVMPVASLDIIFTPLVAFDAHGNRLGMGGGFYDRTLSQLRVIAPLPSNNNVRIIGLAYDCQQVPQLPVAIWDEPLDGIITPGHYWRPNN